MEWYFWITAVIGYMFMAGITERVFPIHDSPACIFWPLTLPAYVGSTIELSSLKLLYTKPINLIKNNMKTFFGIILLLAFFGGVYWASTSYVEYNNQFDTLTADYNALEKDSEVIYDEVWKTIQQTANVSDQYSEEFKEIFPEIMQARYGSGGGQLFLWLTEANPNFTPELYSRLMTTIETKRASFTTNQRALIRTWSLLIKLTTTIPSSWFLSNRTVETPRLVTSTRTQRSFDTGIDDDTTLFPSDTNK